MKLRQALILIPLLILLPLAGCQKSTPSADNESENLVDSAKGPSQNADDDSLALQTKIALQTDAEFLKKMSDLHKKANGFESQLKFDEAFEVWCEIEKLVAAKYGRESWQMANVVLAKETAQTQAKFTNAQKRVLLSIGQLQQAIAKSVNEKDFSGAYENGLAVSRLTQNLFGNESHHFGQMQIQLGRICLLNRQTGIAISYFETGRKILRNRLGESHPDVETTTYTIGQVYQQSGQFAEAKPYLEESVKLSAKIWGVEDITYASRCHDLGVVYQNLKQYENARQMLETSATIREKEMGADHPQLAHNLRNLGVVLEDQKAYKQAAAKYRQAVEIFSSQLGDDNSFTVDCRVKLSVMYTLLEDNENAEAILRKIAASQQRTLGTNNQYFAQTLFRLATVLSRQKKFEEAEPFFKQALATQRQVLGERNPATLKTTETYALLLERTNRTKAAEQLRSGLRNVGFDQELKQKK